MGFRLIEYFTFYSNYVHISIERDGDKFKEPETIRIQGSKTVSDLLKISRSSLEFTEHDKLSAHKIPRGECIPDSVRIHDIAHLGTVVIKCNATKENHEDAATHKKHGLASIPEKQDENSEIRHRGDLSEFGAARRNKMTQAYQREIKFLNMKFASITSRNVKGFVFQIIPGDYEDEPKELGDSILTFHSEKELEEKQCKILRVIPDWSSWQPSEALPCWGVRINNNIGKDKPSKKSYRKKNQESSKTPIAIVTRTRFHPVREFGVNVTLGKKAVNEAKKILKVWKQERQNTFKKFNDEYCSFIYSGKFCAGAWLRTAVTAKPTKGQDAKYLEKCATEETEHLWENQTNRSPRNKDASVKTSNVHVYDPPNIQNINQMKKIEHMLDCTIFPANWDQKRHFTPVYEIMQSQAKENNDKDLLKVSDIFKECMKGNTTFLFLAH